MRNLHKAQAGRGVNAPGQPEIPESVFEELLVNALVHRDYLVSAPIRLFIFDNRIKILSAGHLPNNLTVAKIRAGNSNIRNPILVSYVAKRGSCRITVSVQELRGHWARGPTLNSPMTVKVASVHGDSISQNTNYRRNKVGKNVGENVGKNPWHSPAQQASDDP